MVRPVDALGTAKEPLRSVPMRLPAIWLPVDVTPVISTPLERFPEITLPAPETVPPIVLAAVS